MDAMELPEDVKQQLEKFEAAVASVEAGLEPLLLANRRELEQALSPVERAKVHVTLANAVSTLFCSAYATSPTSPSSSPNNT
jgi:exosome complex protein LRP1